MLGLEFCFPFFLFNLTDLLLVYYSYGCLCVIFVSACAPCVFAVSLFSCLFRFVYPGLFSNERKKGVDLGRWGSGKDLGRFGGEGKATKMSCIKNE